jgi:hypothetical protein
MQTAALRTRLLLLLLLPLLPLLLLLPLLPHVQLTGPLPPCPRPPGVLRQGLVQCVGQGLHVIKGSALLRQAHAGSKDCSVLAAGKYRNVCLAGSMRADRVPHCGLGLQEVLGLCHREVASLAPASNAAGCAAHGFATHQLCSDSLCRKSRPVVIFVHVGDEEHPAEQGCSQTQLMLECQAQRNIAQLHGVGMPQHSQSHHIHHKTSHTHMSVSAGACGSRLSMYKYCLPGTCGLSRTP